MRIVREGREGLGKKRRMIGKSIGRGEEDWEENRILGGEGKREKEEEEEKMSRR